MTIREPAHAQSPLFEDRSLDQKIASLHTLVEDLYSIYFYGARKHILRILDGYICSNEEEIHNVNRIRDLIERVPNIFCQNCEVGHITGSALVVNVQTESFLLHYHKKLDKWLQFGGHCGFGENGFEVDPADVALREAQEETGIRGLQHLLTELAAQSAASEGKMEGSGLHKTICPVDIDIHDVPAWKGAPHHVHLDFRYVIVVRDKNSVIQPAEGESTQFLWTEFHKRELLKEKIDSSLCRLIGKAELLLMKK